MIRLPSSRIQLTEADVNYHLQRVLANRSILTEIFLQSGAFGGRDDSYIALPPSPSSSLLAYAFDSLDPDFDDKGDSSFMTDGTQDLCRLADLELYDLGGQSETLGRVTSPPELLDFEPLSNADGYVTDIANDGRIAGRRSIEEPWPSTSTRASGSNSVHPSGTFSSLRAATSSHSSNPPTGARHWSRSRNPHTRHLTDPKLFTLGSQLDGSTPGFSSTSVHRHAARKSSLLRFRRNIDSEESQEGNQVVGDGTQERNGLSHRGGSDVGNNDDDSGTSIPINGHGPRHLPNHFVSSNLYREDNLASISGKNSPNRGASYMDQRPIRGRSPSPNMSSIFSESSNAFVPMPLYLPSSCERSPLPGDPDTESERGSTSLSSDVIAEETGEVMQRQAPENSGSGYETDESEAPINAALTLQSMSSREEEVLEPHSERHFTLTRPSIVAREMRGLDGSGRSDSPIRQRLDSIVHSYGRAERAVINGNDSGSETLSDSGSSDEGLGFGNQPTRPLDRVGSSSMTHIDPDTPGAQRIERLLHIGDSASRSRTGGLPETPRRVQSPQRSPTSLQNGYSSRIRREIQVFDDRYPATQPRPQNRRERAHWNIPHGRHEPQTSPRRRASPSLNGSPTRRSTRIQRRGASNPRVSQSPSVDRTLLDDLQRDTDEVGQPAASGSTHLQVPRDPATYPRGFRRV
ncbi:hypothetical protein FQN54_000018 [Arachnomyces sp. PD_36]|nr:hypothetical protein FQN54_000018 [Arachnomyces sp. PD_36]